ncbi:MAG TPA: amino acid transporter [Pasteurellaceae bacterium]|nr:amino acid transporter [Pasteurellaceae bacterium]
MDTFIQGFLISGGLIVAIGAQNAYVLKQGLLKRHIFWISLTCFLCDFILISLGVLGLGYLISQSPIASVALSFVGALFLLVYGARAFKSAYVGNVSMIVEGHEKNDGSALKAVFAALAITLLNPHVYLDTVVIIGGIAGTLSLSEKWLFLFGAIFASGIWFFGLGYGARCLIPLFKRPMTWRILDVVIGIVMWLIAGSLIKYGMGLL